MIPTEVIAWARAAEAAYLVPASLNLSAAILESDLGKATPPNSNNWHGIKSAAGSNAITREQRPDGQWYEIASPFAVFATPADSFVAYAKLLRLGEPYRAAMTAYLASPRAPADVQALTRAIAKSYATALAYGETLVNIQVQSDLYQYDAASPAAVAPATVRDVQARLNALGASPPLLVDDDAGPATCAAILKALGELH